MDQSQVYLNTVGSLDCDENSVVFFGAQKAKNVWAVFCRQMPFHDDQLLFEMKPISMKYRMTIAVKHFQFQKARISCNFSLFKKFQR